MIAELIVKLDRAAVNSQLINNLIEGSNMFMIKCLKTGQSHIKVYKSQTGILTINATVL
jgi:hypothetical protein